MIRTSKRTSLAVLIAICIIMCLLEALVAAEKADPQTIPFRRFGLGWKTTLEEEITTLRIWYTLDNGHTWRLYSETTAPTSPAPVKVSEDGVYGFYTQTKDKAGLEEEPPVPGTPPKAVVIVDTKKPALVLVNPNSSDIYSNTQDIRIEWNATDANFVSSPLSLYFSNDGGGSWNVIKKNMENTGSYNWKLPAGSSEYYKVKIVAIDRAGNEAEDISDNNFTVDGKAPVSRVTGPKNAKTPSFNVDYTANDLGGAGIAKIAIYFQVNSSNEWHFYGEDKDLKSPFLFQAKQGGRYGFKLVATDRVGNSESMPDASTRPDVVCLMDSINPMIKLTSFKGKSIKPVAASHEVPITWQATDDNIANNPITIELSKDDGGTWNTVLVSDFKNSGLFPWTIPTMANDVHKARLRITALDVLGNKGVDISDPFFIDGTKPVSTITIIQQWDEDKKDFEKTRIEKNIKLDPAQGVIQTPQLTPSEFVTAGMEALKIGDYTTAEEMTKNALKNDPNNFVAHAILGRIYYEKAQLDKAIESYSRSISLNRNYQESRVGLGVTYYTLGQSMLSKDKEKTREYFKKAVLEYEAAVQILPDTWEETFNLGYIYARLQRYNDAILYLKKSIPLSNNNGDTFWYLGQVFEKLDNKKEALSYYQQAVRAYPSGSLKMQKAEVKVRQLQGT